MTALNSKCHLERHVECVDFHFWQTGAAAIGLGATLNQQKTAQCAPPSPYTKLVSDSFFGGGKPNTDNLERTYIMIKPDGVQRGLVGKIIQRFEDRGLKLVGLKMMRTSSAAHS